MAELMITIYGRNDLKKAGGFKKKNDILEMKKTDFFKYLTDNKLKISSDYIDSAGSISNDKRFRCYYNGFIIGTSKIVAEFSKMEMIKCIQCDWIGEEEDLKFILEDENDLESGMNACPNCKTDGYLSDITIDKYKIISERIEYKDGTTKNIKVENWKGLLETLDNGRDTINKIFLFREIPGLDSKIRAIYPPIGQYDDEYGLRVTVEIDLFESLGEQGGDIYTEKYKRFPSEDRIREDTKKIIKSTYDDLRDSILTAREESQLEATKKILKIKETKE